MQSCRDVAYLISSDGFEHAGWPTRLLTRLHLRYCEACRQHAAELAMIGRIGRETWSADSVDQEAVQQLEGAIMDYATGAHGEGEENTSDDEDEPTHS